MSKRDYKAYDRLYRLTKSIVCPVIKRKLFFSGDLIPDDIGPMFILCNHNTDLDFVLLAAQSRKNLDFVATDAMSRMGFVSRWACRKFDPILHDKGSKGVDTIRQIKGRIDDGRSILLFPEGNRSFDGRTGEVSEAIGKIVKMIGASLVLYRIKGGYLTTPRWGRGIRKGRMKGSLEKVLSPDEIKAMPAKQLQKLIEDALMTDAYKEQEEDHIKYRSQVKAEYLESLLFICPKCRKAGTFKSKKNELSCSCGYKFVMDEYGYLSDEGLIKHSITELFSQQKSYLDEMKAGSNDSILWSDDVKLSRLKAGNKYAYEEKIKIAVTNESLMIGSQEVEHGQISSVDIVQRNRLIIHVKKSDVRYEFTGEKTFNAVKYQIWYDSLCKSKTNLS